MLLEGVDALELPLSVLRNDHCDLLVEGSQRCAGLVAQGRGVADLPTGVMGVIRAVAAGGGVSLRGRRLARVRRPS